MPNKKSRAKHAPAIDFDLPPSALAKTTNLSSSKARTHKAALKHGRRAYTDDDTPKAFARLMARASGATVQPRSGLDDGNKPRSKNKNKKRKREQGEKEGNGTVGQEKKEGEGEKLQIRPGEKMSEFRRRVDLAMPVAWKGGGGDPDERKRERQRRKQQNRVQDSLARAKSADADGDGSDTDSAAEKERELWGEAEGAGKRRKKGGRDASPDPWAELEAKRDKAKFGEVAKAPPTLKKPKAVFKVHKAAAAAVDVGGVPKAAGSLAKREGLAAERQGIIEQYRKMMEEKRAGR